MTGDDRLGDGQAEAGAGNGPFCRVRGPEEAFEEILLVPVRNADAGIRDAHDGPAPAASAVTVTWPPAGVNFTALLSRFVITRASWWASPVTTRP